jgi:hypothetical protein
LVLAEVDVVYAIGALVVGLAALVIGWDMAGQPTPKRIYRRLRRRRARAARPGA